MYSVGGFKKPIYRYNNQAKIYKSGIYISV